jgi:hypothetical protein
MMDDGPFGSTAKLFQRISLHVAACRNAQSKTCSNVMESLLFIQEFENNYAAAIRRIVNELIRPYVGLF